MDILQTVESGSITRLLGILLTFDIGFAGYLGHRLYGEIRRAKWFADQMEKHRARTASLESELESLRPYAVIADAESHAAGIIASAQAQAHDISEQYDKYMNEVLAWTEAAFESATAQAKEIVRGAEPAAKTKPLHYKSRLFQDAISAIHRGAEGPLDPSTDEEFAAPVVSRPTRQSRPRREDWRQNEILFDFERRVA